MTSTRTWTGRILTGLVTYSCSSLGALLLTGFLGGAIATHFRVGDPLLGCTRFPIYIAALLWAELFLRDTRLRVLMPFNQRQA